MSCLSKLDAATKGTKQFSNPQVLNSTLAALRTLQPWVFGLPNYLVLLVLISSYYLVKQLKSNKAVGKFNWPSPKNYILSNLLVL